MASFSDLMVSIGSGIIALLFIGYIIVQIVTIVGVSAPLWFNQTIGNLTAAITGTIVPIFVFVIAVVLLSVAWGYIKNVLGAGSGGQQGY